MLKIVLSLNAQDQAKLRTAGFFFPKVSSLTKLDKPNSKYVSLILYSEQPLLPILYLCSFKRTKVFWNQFQKGKNKNLVHSLQGCY